MDVSDMALSNLLEVQKIDSRIDLLTARRRNLAEQKELDELEAQLNDLDSRLSEQQQLVDEISKRQRQMDAEIETIDSKIKLQDERLYSGDVSNPKELHSLQADIESLKRRRTTIEDADLEVMEEAEIQEKVLAQLTGERKELLEKVEVARGRRDLALGGLEEELTGAIASRGEWAPKIDAALLEFYEELRAQKGGVGIATLVGDTCQGCHMQLPAQEVTQLRRTEGLKRCDECRRILVVI